MNDDLKKDGETKGFLGRHWPIMVVAACGVLVFIHLEVELRAIHDALDDMAEHMEQVGGPATRTGSRQVSSLDPGIPAGELAQPPPPAHDGPGQGPQEKSVWDCDGSISGEELESVRKANETSLQECIDGAKKQNPGMTGTVDVVISIGSNGEVRATRVVESKSDGDLVHCLTELVHTWKFPKPANGICAKATLVVQF